MVVHAVFGGIDKDALGTGENKLPYFRPHSRPIEAHPDFPESVGASAMAMKWVNMIH